jgi:hypothetical protein
MGHYKIDEKTRGEITPVEWLPVGRQIGEMANEWAVRNDLVAYVGPGAGGPAPACFIPATAEIEVNVDVAFGYGVEPADIAINTRDGRYEFPRATGAIMHEAFHARFSRWSMEKARETLAGDEFAALVLLEEARIEAQGIEAMPKARPFLRACALELVLADARESFGEESSTKGAASLVGLIYSRVDAGILPLHDVVEVTDLIDEFLGLDVVNALREIATKAREHSVHDDATNLYPLAREWAALVREVADEKGEASPEKGEASPERGEGEGEGGGMSEALQDMLDALEDAADGAAIGANDALDDAEQAERYEDVVSERAEQAREIRDNKGVASKVFGRGSSVIDFGKSHSSLIDRRSPKPEERAAAIQVATMLEKAKYRERDVVEVSTAIPAGRLHARAMVQGAALKSRGIMSQVEPWRKKVRKSTDEPTLTVGVLVDISGSMGDAMNPMATTAYVMGEASKRVQGKCAMVYYGNDVFPTLRPGERHNEVRVYSAPDGTEKFDSAFRALDGTLDLLHGQGARLLVIVSDGAYTTDETASAKKWMRRCGEEGVAVVWLPFDRGDDAARIAGDHGTVLAGKFSPTEAATKIGKACADALGKVAGRRVS